MKRMESVQMEEMVGGDLDAACGFTLGIATVAALATSPIAPMTWGFIGSAVVSACGAAILDKIYL